MIFSIFFYTTSWGFERCKTTRRLTCEMIKKTIYCVARNASYLQLNSFMNSSIPSENASEKIDEYVLRFLKSAKKKRRKFFIRMCFYRYGCGMKRCADNFNQSRPAKRYAACARNGNAGKRLDAYTVKGVFIMLC